MLSQVDVMTRRGQTFSLSMGEDESGYAVREIEGLGPVKASLVSTGYAGQDGEQYQSAKRGPRNVKIKLDLEPDFANKTYTDLRQDLYDYFMPKSEVVLRFYQDTGLYVDIVAHVEDFDSPLFEKEPDVTISLMCFMPDFIDPRAVHLTGNTVATTVARDILYSGTVETDTVFTLFPNRSVPAFSLYNTTEDGQITQFDFSADLIADDKLVVSSVKGNKGIWLTRAGVTTSVLYGRSTPVWMQFFRGHNLFRAYVPGDPVPYTLDYSVRYGGL